MTTTTEPPTIYDPASIWALATAGRQVFGSTTINIILTTAKTRAPGDYCFIVRNGRLYIKHNRADSFLTKVSPDLLETNSGVLGPVFAYNWDRRGDCVLLGQTYQQFIQKITQPKL
jgi:hypothetical protein